MVQLVLSIAVAYCITASDGMLCIAFAAACFWKRLLLILIG
jgi:hypothetical protein